MLCCVVLCCVLFCWDVNDVLLILISRCVVLCCFVLSFIVLCGDVCDVCDVSLILISCGVVVGGVRSLISMSLTENLNRGRPQSKEDEPGVISD